MSAGDEHRLAGTAALQALADLRAALLAEVPADRLAIGVLDADRSRLLLHEDDGEGELRLMAALPVQDGHLAAALRYGRPVAGPAAEIPSPRDLAVGGQPPALVVPLEAFGRATGALRLLRLEGPPFSEAEAATVAREAAARGAALREMVLHLRTEHAESAARRSYEQLVAFSRVGNLIVQEKDLDRICSLFMQALKEHSVFRRGILTLLDEELKGYKWFFFGMSDEEIEYFHSHSSNKMTREQRARIFQEKYRVGNSYYLPAAAGSDWGVRRRDPRHPLVDWHPDDFLFIPLYGSHKRLVGIVSMDEPVDGRAPTAETLSSLELFANQVAHSIEEKKLDLEVKKSTRKYRTLVETMNDGLVVMDMSERITLVNPTLCRLVGYRVEDMIGSSLYTFLADSSRQAVEAKRDERRLGIKSRYEVELLSKEGGRIPVLLSGAPLYEANRLVGSFAVVSDLREQKKAEVEFRKMHGEIVDANEKLRQSMERLKTTQEQLVQAEKLSAIGELVSGVAHELNNPLTGVLGYAQLLMGRDVGEEMRKKLGTIYSEAVRCQKIVQNLLTFARKHTPEKSLVDLNDIIRATVELRSYQLRVDNIEVELDLSPELPRTMADGHQLQQVLINLINNAHHAMVDHHGRGRLSLATSVADGQIQVVCRDDGPGIPDENVGRIFDPFFTTKDVGKGTGLGLSLSYGIMREHGGSISVARAAGGGAEFRLELPVRTPAVAAEPAPPSPQPGSAGAGGSRILVVDDEITVLELLSELLSSLGHRVETAGDGRAALSRLEAGADFDVVITDMKMPVMGGRELYGEIRRRHPALAGRLVFATGDTVSAEARSFLESTGNPVVSKPFRLEEMQGVISRLQDEGAPCSGTGASS